MKIVYLSLGANLGDREAHLDEALRRLEQEGVRLLRRSSIYETEPQDFASQRWFLNLVAEVETVLFPRQLLRLALKIERQMGRKRLVPKGPRAIDIDLLLYGSSVIESSDLTIPHPRLTERRFVLEPLVELAPQLRHPVTRQSMAELLAGVRDQGLRKWTGGHS